MLSVRGISKAFAGTRALQGVDLDVQPGEIVGLVGANGAGKSTLVRILDGLVQPDEGEIRVGGRAVRLATPREARSAGIGFVHQHSATFEALTVAQNILIEERQVVLLPRRMDARAREVLQNSWRRPHRPCAANGRSAGRRPSDCGRCARSVPGAASVAF